MEDVVGDNKSKADKPRRNALADNTGPTNMEAARMENDRMMDEGYERGGKMPRDANS